MVPVCSAISLSVKAMAFQRSVLYYIKTGLRQELILKRCFTTALREGPF
jgi:hypothetical protein